MNFEKNVHSKEQTISKTLNLPNAAPFCSFIFSPLFNNECVTQRFNELPRKLNQKGSPLSKRIIKVGNGQRSTIIVGDGEPTGMTQEFSWLEKSLWDCNYF